MQIAINSTVTNAEDVYIGSSSTDGSAYYIRTKTVEYDAGNACRTSVIDTRYGESKIINYTFFKSHRNMKYYAYKTGNSKNYFSVNDQEDTMFSCAYLLRHNALS